MGSWGTWNFKIQKRCVNLVSLSNSRLLCIHVALSWMTAGRTYNWNITVVILRADGNLDSFSILRDPLVMHKGEHWRSFGLNTHFISAALGEKSYLFCNWQNKFTYIYVHTFMDHYPLKWFGFIFIWSCKFFAYCYNERLIRIHQITVSNKSDYMW